MGKEKGDQFILWNEDSSKYPNLFQESAAVTIFHNLFFQLQFFRIIKLLWTIQNGDIIHISHDLEGDIPEYQPWGDTKALAYCHPMPKACDVCYVTF